MILYPPPVYHYIVLADLSLILGWNFEKKVIQLRLYLVLSYLQMNIQTSILPGSLMKLRFERSAQSMKTTLDEMSQHKVHLAAVLQLSIVWCNPPGNSCILLIHIFFLKRCMWLKKSKTYVGIFIVQQHPLLMRISRHDSSRNICRQGHVLKWYSSYVMSHSLTSFLSLWLSPRSYSDRGLDEILQISLGLNIFGKTA